MANREIVSVAASLSSPRVRSARMRPEMRRKTDLQMRRAANRNGSPDREFSCQNETDNDVALRHDRWHAPFVAQFIAQLQDRNDNDPAAGCAAYVSGACASGRIIDQRA